MLPEMNNKWKSNMEKVWDSFEEYQTISTCAWTLPFSLSMRVGASMRNTPIKLMFCVFIITDYATNESMFFWSCEIHTDPNPKLLQHWNQNCDHKWKQRDTHLFSKQSFANKYPAPCFHLQWKFLANRDKIFCVTTEKLNILKETLLAARKTNFY